MDEIFIKIVSYKNEKKIIRAFLKTVAPFIDDARVVIYDRNVFIIQATRLHVC